MKTLDVVRWNDGKREVTEEIIADEAYLHLNIEEVGKFQISITPEKIQPFAAGFIYTQGFIESLDQIDRFRINSSQKSQFTAKIKLQKGNCDSETEGKETLWREEGYGITPWSPAPRPIKSSMKITPERLISCSQNALADTPEFAKTGAFHYAFLISPSGNIAARAKDIGRHNAVDKAVGQLLLGEDSLTEAFLLSTGRISKVMVMKCLRAKIPLIVSRGAPLMGAVELATQSNLGLVGFLRDRRFNIYAGEGFING
ncbi:MAG: formate dehydrogenase accessory sulfurtransferase FdhD [Candidatus Acetothermia bacterium]